MLSRSSASLLPLLALGAAGTVFAACSSPPPPRPPAAPIAAPKQGSVPSRWRTVQAPPMDDPNNPSFDVAGSKLIVDPSGGRWLFGPSSEENEAGGGGGAAGAGGRAAAGRPRTRELVDEGPLLARYADPKLGFLALAADGRLLGNTDVLGPLQTLATLPLGTKPDSLRFFRGGITFFGREGPSVIGADGSRKRVRTMPGYVLAEALLGADGAGVGLFLPESVGVTRDGGATWTQVETNDLRVKKLGLQDGTPLLLPGGVRDRFARGVDVASGTLTRVVEELTPDERRARARQHRSRNRGFYEGPMDGLEMFGFARRPWAYERLSPELALSGQRGSAAVGDGDRVVAFHPDPQNHGRLLMRRGRIGEALASYGGEALGSCVSVGAATCGDVTAVLCGDKLHVFRGDETVVTSSAPLGTQIGFDQDKHLVAVLADEETRTVSWRRWTTDYTATVTPEPVPGLTRGPFTLLGGCGASAFWIYGGGAAVRWSPELRAFEPAIDLPADAAPLAVNDQRSLVASNGNDLLFFPEETVAPLGPHQAGYVSFTRGGRHALYVAPSGQVQQSDDGGRSFSPITTPAVRRRLPVVCGEQRCQLGDGAWREGFVREDGPIAIWPEPPGKGPPPRRETPPPPPPDQPAAMSCKEDPALFADLPGGPIVPRLGPWLFAGASTDDKGGYLATFGDTSGKDSQIRLPVSAPPNSADVSIGPGIVVSATYVTYRQSLTGVFRWEPKGPANTIKPMPYGMPTLLAEDGFGSIDAAAGELVFWGKERTQRRAYRTERHPRDSGLLHVEADGGWIAAEMVDRGELRLISMPEGGRSDERTLTVSPPDTPEQAVGFLPGSARRIVLLEPTEDGGTELRIRPVSASFALGPATPVPNTHVAGGLLSLPTCDASAKGALVYARSYGNRAVEIGTRRTMQEFSRLLRVSESTACVERTFTTAGQDLFSAGLVVAGNGGVAASTDGPGGLRCGALDPRPLPAAP